MHAMIRKNQVNKFRHPLVEGCIFYIKNFKVMQSTGQYQSIMNDYMIIFLLMISVRKAEKGGAKIDHYGFQFISPELLDSQINDNRILSGLINFSSIVVLFF